MDNYLSLAKKTVEEYIKTGKLASQAVGLRGCSEMTKKRAGVFVSIHKLLRYPSPPPRELKRKTRLHRAEIYDGIEPPSPIEELRGCIGTYLPTQKNIAYEIIHNAIEAATQDPRFPPITVHELPDLVYSVDVLSEPEPVTDTTKLDPQKYGVIVESQISHRRGLLLPDLEGVDTVSQQISICRQKAWVAEDEPIILYRFTVERHK